MKMVERRVSMHIHEYKREDYDQIANTFTDGYVTVSQFAKTPKLLSEVNWNQYGTERYKTLELVRFSTGQFLFGINPDGTLTQLKSLIDSSG